MTDDDFKPLAEAMKRFVRDAKAEGEEVRAWPLNDETFQITGIQTPAVYALVFGIDHKGRDGMLVVPKFQLAVQMRCELAGGEKPQFGFIRTESELGN